jgi:CMP-N-acetylneuraminic acid synthetase
MNNYTALIAMRSGSKRFPGKHLAKCGTLPICELAAIECNKAEIPNIWIASDDLYVIRHLRKVFFALQYWKRNITTITDKARVESCVKEFLQTHKSIEHLIFFPGANSCWLTSTDIQQAIEQYERTGANSLITLAPLKRYLYSRDLQGWIEPLTQDTYRRGFLGNLPPVWIENGSFYILNAKKFLETDSFRIEPCTGFIMDKETERELDTPLDLAVINTVKGIQ